MTQINGYKGFVGYSIRELSSSEMILYCSKNNSLSVKTLPLGQRKINFTSDFMIRAYSSGCYYYDVNTGKWSSNGMDIYEDTNLIQTHCSSNHLTSFAGGLDLLPSEINFQYAFSNPSPIQNPLIYSTILLVTFVYFFFGLLAFYLDWRNSKKINVTFMKDNYPSDLYFYELILYTGDKRESGTNSKVILFSLKKNFLKSNIYFENLEKGSIHIKWRIERNRDKNIER
jgi:polycystin 1L2